MEFKQGATRNVVLVGRLAFKFPRLREWRLFLHGLLANMQEAGRTTSGRLPDKYSRKVMVESERTERDL